MIQFNALQWGQVLQEISVSGLDPASGQVKKVTGSGVITPKRSSGRTNGVSGSGGSPHIKGSS